MRLFASLAVVFAVAFPVCAADEKPEDTPKAAKMRKLLKTKIKEVEFKEERTEDVMNELKEQVKGLRIHLDTKGGVSRNKKLTYKGKDVTLEQVLAGLFDKQGLGYIVISDKKNPYDGDLMIRVGEERGYPKKK